ncbi:MAG: alpha/beta hydrolase, partial [Actinomycetota bacterium]|nr:alpha/beta hydrolase [Actinomycetota bacterium]
MQYASTSWCYELAMAKADGTPVRERHEEVAGVPVLWREAPPPPHRRGAAPVLYLHGVPTDGADFLPLLARTGGVAPDLPGFGRSGKASTFDYSIDGYASFLESFVAHLGWERLSLVAHDWGVLGLILAQRRPERIERLVVIAGVPLLPGYRWHRWARLWRRRFVGEMTMGLVNRFVMRRVLREGSSAPRSANDALAEKVWRHFDHGTQRAIIRLYRSSPPEVLEAAGSRLEDVVAPALVVWGERDPFVPSGFASAYADALGGPARVEVKQGAGHWPWLDRPEVVEEIASFLD